jgi:Acetyltransferase (GNAT) family.
MNLTLHDAETVEEIDLFWEKRNEYQRSDIIPNCEKPLTEEEINWFYSKEYKDHIMKLYGRDIDKLYLVFFEKETVKIGFSVYVTYHSEDGKCFIVDFCIYGDYRNKGYGKACFDLIRDREMRKGAAYFSLNLSNENNRRFWTSLGFYKTAPDEYGNDIYVLK